MVDDNGEDTPDTSNLVEFKRPGADQGIIFSVGGAPVVQILPDGKICLREGCPATAAGAAFWAAVEQYHPFKDDRTKLLARIHHLEVALARLRAQDSPPPGTGE